MLIIYHNLEDTGKIPYGVEDFSAIERFLADECFALDNINPPRAINWNRFTKENLDLCYNVYEESEKVAFNLELQSLELQLLEIPPKKIRTKNWNDQIGPKRIRSPVDVNVYYNNEIINGKLIISEQNV